MDGVDELEFYIDPRNNMKITIDDEEYQILSLKTQGNIVITKVEINDETTVDYHIPINSDIGKGLLNMEEE
tara:strand:- start:300 stop:512 length:213 start_codon:yes stop_codon:yes gene_type:complete